MARLLAAAAFLALALVVAHDDPPRGLTPAPVPAPSPWSAP